MSGIGEIVGVIACVAGVISAYHDGGAIIQKIKLRRAAKRAPAPPRLLEESIDQAPEEIEREKNRGIARFGKAFESGDHIAVIALQQITIQLQGSLLDKLKKDDEGTDFMFLVDAADSGRDRTIGVLLELRQRLMLAKPMARELEGPGLGPVGYGIGSGGEGRRMEGLREARQQRRDVVQTRELPIHSVHEPPPAPVPAATAQAKQHKTWTREYSTAHEASRDEDGDASTGAEDNANLHPTRKRHSSLLGFLHRTHRSHSGSQDSVPKIEEQPRRLSKSPAAAVSFQPPPTCDAREMQMTASPSQQQQFQYQPWEDDPAAIWGAGAPKTSSEQRRDTAASIHVPPDEPSQGLSPTSLSMTQRSLSRQSLAPSTSLTPTQTHTTASTSVPTPTPENEYLGFCKSAWRLQNGERKAMQKAKEFNDGWSQSSVYYLACTSSKCAFAGHIDVSKLWTKVWTVEAKGLKFRWPFLAKSHVPQQKVKDHQYAYQCLFCVFLGEKGAVYFGTDTYLDHVSTGHRGQGMSEVVAYKTKCIADRVAEEGEEFDINLFPLNAQESLDRHRKQSEVLSDDLLAFAGPSSKKSEEGKDSLFSSNEPWNEGLSDFHWCGDGIERAELE